MQLSSERPIADAPTTGAVPRSIRQLQDSKYKNRTAEPDPIQTLMTLMCSERGTSEKFIRRLTITEDSYNIVLYTDEQVQYLCNNLKATIHVDITFNLSENPTNMYGLVTTIRAHQYKGDPLLLGPILLTTKQRSKDYITLWQDMCSNNPKLSGLSVFVTDGESALMNSIQQTFPDAHLLRCMLHLTDNCKLKAKESQLPEAIVSEVIRQLMLSTPFSFKEDAEKSAAALQKLASQEKVEKSMEKFLKYYRRNTLPTIFENLVDNLIGIGVDVLQRTNNPSESMNNKIKKHITSGSKVDKVCQDLKSIALAQNEELRKAAKHMSHQYIQKEEKQVDRGTIQRNTTPSADDQ